MVALAHTNVMPWQQDITTKTDMKSDDDPTSPPSARRCTIDRQPKSDVTKCFQARSFGHQALASVECLEKAAAVERRCVFLLPMRIVSGGGVPALPLSLQQWQRKACMCRDYSVVEARSPKKSLGKHGNGVAWRRDTNNPRSSTR